MSRGRGQRSIELIEASHDLLEEIQPASVRAVCYRLFVLELIPSMSKGETAKVSKRLTAAREDGTIPWSWIVDETRAPETTSTWADPRQFLRAVTRSYRKDKWDAQPVRVEVWSEKGTVRGTLAPVLDQYEVDFRVMHGYASATAINEAAETIRDAGRPVVILYVGDWDPSGLHMSEVDLPERLARYTEGDGEFTLRRIALVEDDTAGLPSFPAATKAKDTRYAWYVQNYGPRCWELDAMSPVDLRARVDSEILRLIEPVAWERYRRVEITEQASIEKFISSWKSNPKPRDERAKKKVRA